MTGVLAGSVVERLSMRGGRHALTLIDVGIDTLSLASGTVRLRCTESRIDAIEARHQTLCLTATASGERPVAAKIRADASVILIDCDDADVVIGPGAVFVRGTGWRRSQARQRLERLDETCVVVTFAPLDIVDSGQLAGGVFGELAGPLSHARFPATSWGIISTSELTGSDIRVIGDLVIVSSDRFSAEILPDPAIYVLAARPRLPPERSSNRAADG